MSNFFLIAATQILHTFLCRVHQHKVVSNGSENVFKALSAESTGQTIKILKVVVLQLDI